MCVLGMAEEFRGQIAVNALWPRTGQWQKPKVAQVCGKPVSPS